MQFIVRLDLHCGVEVTVSDFPGRGCELADGTRDRACDEVGESHRAGDSEQRNAQEHKDCLSLQIAVFLFQDADIQHAHDLVAEIPNGFVSRDVPVVDDIGATDPRLALDHHLVVDILCHSCTDGARAIFVSDIGRYPHVVLKYCGGSDVLRKDDR